MKPIAITAPEPPTVDEALERLAGRRAASIELQAHERIIVETKGQNRRTRRNNLRIALAKARADRKASTTVTLTDAVGVSRFEVGPPFSYEDVEAVTGISVEDQRGDGKPRGTVTVVSIDEGPALKVAF